MRSSTNVYLLSLAVCDSLYLLFCLTLSFLHCSNKRLSRNTLAYIPIARVLSDIFGNTAVWLTVWFTIERFVAVKLPMKGKAWCTVRKAKLAIVAIFITCAINTSPEFFETTIVSMTASGSNESEYFKCTNTEFAESHSYQFGYYWWFVTIFTFTPLVLLSVINSLLIKTVWEANKRRQMLLQSRVMGETQKYNREQQLVTMMLIVVVLIFIICQTPQAVLLIYRSNAQTDGQSVSMDFIRIAGNICNFLVQVNASVNFILYSYFSSKFRRTLKTLVCRCSDSRMKTIHTRSFAESFRGQNSTMSRSTFRLTVTARSSIKPRKCEYNSVRVHF
ncbi:FMRFamide peptide receptor frpr-18-like [Dreissena polymorpha]|uniref:FMRFamide peptide receptor frpr-18-like n=1 Tax=Dreissena polymorpha TaxID=45954 RepID=UPI0022640966|nr:FMRFamide peptide receptor frpr-18-like [Dreissena polymorpha]